MKRRVALDFSLDEKSAARLTLGLGDSHTPGFSLFTMPMVDVKEMTHEVSLGFKGRHIAGHTASVPKSLSTAAAACPVAGRSSLEAPLACVLAYWVKLSHILPCDASHNQRACLPVQTSSWRSAEVVDGRSYGRVPGVSTGGVLPHAQVSTLLEHVPAGYGSTATGP